MLNIVKISKLYIVLALMVAPLQVSQSDLYKQARSVHDISALPFESISKAAGQNWVVIRVTPQTNSGSATIPGAYIEAETGRVVIPSDSAAPVITKQGTWELIAALQKGGSPIPRVGRYSWNEPIDRKRQTNPEDIYSPFTNGGILFCRLNLNEKGAEQFQPCYLVPDEWQNDVIAAHEQAKRHPKSSMGPATRLQARRLAQMTADKNPILALHAFQSLIRDQQSDPKTLGSILETSREQRRAVFIYVVVVNPTTVIENTRNTLKRLIANSAKADELKPIALGAFAAVLFQPHSKDAQAIAGELLVAIRDRAAEIGADADVDLVSIFKVTGVTN